MITNRISKEWTKSVEITGKEVNWNQRKCKQGIECRTKASKGETRTASPFPVWLASDRLRVCVLCMRKSWTSYRQKLFPIITFHVLYKAFSRLMNFNAFGEESLISYSISSLSVLRKRVFHRQLFSRFMAINIAIEYQTNGTAIGPTLATLGADTWLLIVTHFPTV